MRFIGKTGARSCGPIGCPVPGWMIGWRGEGKSAWILYHCFGISSSLRKTLNSFIVSSFYLEMDFSFNLLFISIKKGKVSNNNNWWRCQDIFAFFVKILEFNKFLLDKF
jgi:hypothetical protein